VGFVLEELVNFANRLFELKRAAHRPESSLHRLANFLDFEKTFIDRNTIGFENSAGSERPESSIHT
jgi:hypothetical protein